LAACLSVYNDVDMGYDYADLAREGTYLAKGIELARGKIYSQHSYELIVYGPGVEYEYQGPTVIGVHKQLQNSTWCLPPIGGFSTFDKNWMRLMLDSNTDSSGKSTLCTNRTELDMCQPEDFYPNFHEWRKPQIFAKGVLAAGSLLAETSKFTTDWDYSEGDKNYTIHNKIDLSFDNVQLDVKDIESRKGTARIQAYLEMADEWRTTTAATGLTSTAPGFEGTPLIFMYGAKFTELEVLKDIKSYFWVSAAISMGAICACALLFGLSYMGAFVVTLLCTVLFLELYGLLYYFGLKFQEFVCVCAVMSFGIGVEFIAHPVVAYEHSTGTVAERVVEGMRRTGMPVFEGGISSIIGFVMMAASQFAYVRKYFFTVTLLIVLLGMLNGLVALPAMLTLFGTERRKEEEKIAEKTKTTSKRPSMDEQLQNRTQRRSSRRRSSTQAGEGGKHLKHLGKSEATFADARRMTATLTQADLDDFDERLVGLRPNAKTQAKIDDVDNPKHAHMGATRMIRFKRVCIEFIPHWIMTNLMCVIPTICASFVCFLYGNFAQKVIENQPPGMNMTGKYDHFSGKGLHNFGYDVVGVYHLRSFVAVIAPTFMVCCLCRTMYSFQWKTYRDFAVYTCPVIVATLIISQLTIATAHQENFFLYEFSFLIMMQLYLVMITSVLLFMSRHVKQPIIFYQLLYYVICIILSFFVFEYCLLKYHYYQDMGDGLKVVISAIATPLLYEVFIITPCRLFSRTWKHTHESTISSVIGVGVGCSKSMTRLLICLIKDPNWVLAASIMMGAWEFLSVTTVRVRDKLMYHVMSSTLDKNEDAFKTMKHKRNRFLRVRNAHLETSYELIFSAAFIFVVSQLRLSFDTSPPYKEVTGAELFENFIIQYITEIVVDFMCVSWVTVMHREPILAVSHEVFSGWTLMTSSVSVFATSYCLSNILPYVMVRRLDSESYWVFA